MNSKSPFLAIFAACLLLAYGPVASAETETRAEPDETEDTKEMEGSWFEGSAAPERDTPAEERAEDQIIDELDPVAPGKTSPSSGQARPENEPRDADDRCLVRTIEAVVDVDSAGRSSELTIDARNGVVSLAGTLPDQASIERVRELVSGVKGVNRVDATGLTTSANRPKKD
ncbi:BON domain-containing protein [Wenzhouxiangella sp. XN24]|uniref:BON domain-containing protein n=1 Tax=Wenzhouxiangella sp. XN24 TaxID=2713569 RepID=UPI0013EB70B2|nr:BON domain-containing protein [Wenzhouxiangella sp. XN24]NGX16550.1 BON domain-containing protein [Wenzhouxiangella sp. XN24]